MPDSPEVYHCGFYYEQDSPANSVFACVNNKDNNDVQERSLSDMKNAQALSLSDYRKYSKYLDNLKKRLIDALNRVSSDTAILTESK